MTIIGITIDTDHAAFDGQESEEIARLLERMAGQARDGVPLTVRDPQSATSTKMGEVTYTD